MFDVVVVVEYITYEFDSGIYDNIGIESLINIVFKKVRARGI